MRVEERLEPGGRVRYTQVRGGQTQFALTLRAEPFTVEVMRVHMHDRPNPRMASTSGSKLLKRC